MTHSRLLSAALLVVLPWLTTSTHASSTHHHAHEHGRGELNIGLEGGRLLVELEIPAVHVVGFEHRASTAAETEAVNRQLGIFEKPAGWLEPAPAAECALEEAHADLEYEGSHASLHAHYEYRCAMPEHLAWVRVGVFEHTDHLESLTAQVVTPSAQRRVEVSPQAATVELTR